MRSSRYTMLLALTHCLASACSDGEVGGLNRSDSAASNAATSGDGTVVDGTGSQAAPANGSTEPLDEMSPADGQNDDTLADMLVDPTPTMSEPQMMSSEDTNMDQSPGQSPPNQEDDNSSDPIGAPGMMGMGGTGADASPDTSAAGAGALAEAGMSDDEEEDPMQDDMSSSGITPIDRVATCDDGPLDAPLPDCAPEPVPDSGDFYADCVARINQFRWECQCLPPLERWVEGEDCANQHSEYDYEVNQAHAGIKGGICENGGNGQNECPGYSPNFGIVEFCLQQMWDEGPGEDFNVHGHYLNMSNPRFTGVACGLFTTPDGKIWSVQNFR
jgi:hypothetical protein